MAGQVARMMPLIVEHVAIDDRVLDSLRRHHEPASAAGQIILHARASGRTDPAFIEDGDIGGQSDFQPSAILDAKKICRLRRDALTACSKVIARRSRTQVPSR